MDVHFGNVAINFLLVIFDSIGVFLLVKKSKILSQKISNAANFSTEINGSLSKKDILYVALIGLSTYIFLTRIPKLLIKAHTVH
jgi:hypothetical protein